jgi:RimJ/RimL family protein N-acetyltransferase
MTVQPVEADEQERLRAETETDLAAAGVAPMSDERLRAIAQDSPWESPEELEAFLADVYAARRRD